MATKSDAQPTPSILADESDDDFEKILGLAHKLFRTMRKKAGWTRDDINALAEDVPALQQFLAIRHGLMKAGGDAFRGIALAGGAFTSSTETISLETLLSHARESGNLHCGTEDLANCMRYPAIIPDFWKGHVVVFADTKRDEPDPHGG